MNSLAKAIDSFNLVDEALDKCPPDRVARIRYLGMVMRKFEAELSKAGGGYE